MSRYLEFWSVLEFYTRFTSWLLGPGAWKFHQEKLFTLCLPFAYNMIDSSILSPLMGAFLDIYPRLLDFQVLWYLHVICLGATPVNDSGRPSTHYDDELRPASRIPKFRHHAKRTARTSILEVSKKKQLWASLMTFPASKPLQHQNVSSRGGQLWEEDQEIWKKG